MTWETFSRYFAAIVIARRLLHCMGVTFFYYIPSLQNLIPWTLSFLTVLLYVICKPHQFQRYNLINTIVETGFFGIHSIIFLFIWADIRVINLTESRRNYLGYGIIGICLSLLVGKIIIITFEQVLAVYKFVTKKKKRTLTSYTINPKRRITFRKQPVTEDAEITYLSE